MEIYREHCVFATVNFTVFIWGGQTEVPKSTAHLNSLYIFDSRTQTCTTRSMKGQRPSGYICCTAAQDGNLLYIYGGLDQDNSLTGSLYCLDLESYSWSKLSAEVSGSPKKMRSCGMVVHGDKIVLFGGITKTGELDELHVFDLSAGSWSCPATTGSKPPPCHSFSFLKVKNNTAMLFGGLTGLSCSNELYSLDLNTMHWTKIPHKNEEPWPGMRYGHAACCIGVDTSNTQLLITGGYSDTFFDDMWLLDITSMTWKKIFSHERMDRRDHAAVTVKITEDVSEVFLFGGQFNDCIVMDTTILRLEKEQSDLVTESSPDQWKVTAIAYDSKGTRKRVHYKKDLQVSMATLTCLRYTDQNGQTQILKICEKIAPKWIEAGDLLGIPPERSGEIGTHHHGDENKCIRDVLVTWLHGNHDNYSANWEGVLYLLYDMRFSELARQLKTALQL